MCSLCAVAVADAATDNISVFDLLHLDSSFFSGTILLCNGVLVFFSTGISFYVPVYCVCFYFF